MKKMDLGLFKIKGTNSDEIEIRLPLLNCL